MKITVVHPSELGASELEQWRTFQQETPSLANPFLAPEFTVAVGSLRSQARVAVLTDGTGIVGFLPFERRRLGYGVAIAAGLTDGQGLVHAPGLEWDPQELLRACDLAVWEFDHLVDGQQPFLPYAVMRAPSPIMDLNDGYEAYLDQVRANSPGLVKRLAKKERQLAREVGPVRFEFDARDAGHVRALMTWKSAQYQRTGRTDRFAQPWIVELIEQLVGTRTQSFAGQLVMLFAGDRPVAGHLLLRNEGVMAGWFPAYDLEFYKYSSGHITRLHTAEQAAARGVRYIDMGRGPKEHKVWFRSRDLFVSEGRVLRRSPAAAVHWVRRAPVRQVRHIVTERPALFSGADRVLRGYARMRAPLRRGSERKGARS